MLQVFVRDDTKPSDHLAHLRPGLLNKFLDLGIVRILHTDFSQVSRKCDLHLQAELAGQGNPVVVSGEKHFSN